MIVFDGVTISFGNGTKALSDVSFAIGKGEFVIVEGHSGAGKTSLMRAVIKDLPISRGKIVIEGDDLSKISAKNLPLLRRKISVIFQDFKLLMDRTIAENIDLALDIIGLEGEVVEKRRKELLELTGLSGKEDYFPKQLSGGEVQRVAIARALAPQPKVLFADEPTGNLDAKTGMSIIKLLQDINETGTTVVMATHDLELVKDLKLRRIRLDHGSLAHDSHAHHHKTDTKLAEGEAT
ncbi:MAG: ATP-binding cassette domain-containing protein [Microgenomates group bacterium]